MSLALAMLENMAHDDVYDSERLVNALWSEAPFTRLPPDAPSELFDYVEEIRNPRRSYAVHRASRRHDFQTLVAQFIVQLRKGCGDRNCDTSSCFTCRTRLAGTRPIRRYSPTSARILAVYMAGCENPYDHLCVELRTNFPGSSNRRIEPKRRPSLPFLAVNRAWGSTTPAPDRDEPILSINKLKIQVHRKPDTCSSQHSPNGEGNQKPSQAAIIDATKCFTISDQPVSKDHRSFAAATFETVAFKMVQWFTPGGIQTLSDMFSQLLVQQPDGPASIGNVDRRTPLTGSVTPQSDAPRRSEAAREHGATEKPEMRDLETAWDSLPRKQNPVLKADDSRTATEGYIKSAKAERRRSTGSTRISPTVDSGRNITLSRYERHGDRDQIAVMRDRIYSDRPKSQSSAQLSDYQPRSRCISSQLGLKGIGSPHFGTDKKLRCPPESLQRAAEVNRQIRGADTEEHQYGPESVLRRPQTLRCLTPSIVEFICDIYSEDGTAERQHFDSDAQSYGPVQNRAGSRMNRKTVSHSYDNSLGWKAFNDQALFSVLSDPRALLLSFSRDGKLLDSQTVWYCMVRLTRAVPDLVFHSLWLAAGSLLLAPEDLHRYHTDDIAIHRSRPLSQCEAGNLLAVCLHALVAAVPVVSDSRTLYEMSRTRAGGQTVSTAGSKQTNALGLEYDDVFSDDLPLRLARRLFLAIAAGRRFADLRKRRNEPPMPGGQNSLLEPLLTQLDFMNNESYSALEFSSADRLLHETRVPTLLLDWARAVLMTNWDGQPYFPEDNAFGGAMAFISAMHQRRNSLLLGDIQFRVDYFSERLDSVEIPVAWASPRPLSGVGHILDYPFLFTSDALISFFRSINFARMSKTYEESSSLQTRMNAIVQPGSLITNPHHKFVLQDLLRTASAKYLILDIGRKNVLRDSFDQLWRREQRELLRPLKVHLGEDGGEEGFDSGGVQQEFFRMAISECLDPIYGAFTVDERTRMAWFLPGSVVETWRFELIGVLVSLALYNGLTLPVTFPRALYRKLLGAAVTDLHHIADGWPDLVSGLTTLLEWDESNGLVEDVFSRTYDFSVSTFGRYISKDMKKPGEAWPSSISMACQSGFPLTPTEESPLVTNTNRDEYVSDYIRYLTDVSVRPQFEAFERGFRRCLCSRSLKLLSPSILQSLVEGIQDIDVLDLRRNTRYVGWDASHRTIKDFWSIVKKYDLDMRRRLLEFVTASDRVPVGGMRNMQFVIQKNGEEEGKKGRLPTAYTCYGTLLLPEYTDKDILKERLGMALENAQGFGFA